MLYDPTRHEPLHELVWNESTARRTIETIVADTEAHFSPVQHWPIHPLAGADHLAPFFDLYLGSSGVVWALHYLQKVGAVRLSRSYEDYADALLRLNHDRMRRFGSDGREAGSYLMGDTGILLLSHWLKPGEEKIALLADLILRNVESPVRELMWGSPGTLLASLFMYERTGQARWADLYLTTARKLWSQLVWSPEHECHYWTQNLYGRSCSFLDAVHGFVGTAVPLIRGRHLMADGEWMRWEDCIVRTVSRTAVWSGSMVNWPAQLLVPEGGATGKPLRMQFCHGSPGFVICLAGWPTDSLDAELLAGGEATWAAGPLQKGSNLCHGTGGNGYAFLKLYERTGNDLWLARARSFAMHGIAQTESHAHQYGQMRYSLWTGDLGFAVYLWHCICGGGPFPTLDAFFA